MTSIGSRGLFRKEQGMKRAFVLLAILLVAALVGTSCSPSPDKTADPGENGYPIKLSRPEKPGAEFHLAASGFETRSFSFTSNGQAGQPSLENLTAELEAAVKVLEVDGIGMPSVMTVTVEKSTVKDGDVIPAALLPEGTVIEASYKSGRPVFTVGGAPVNRKVEHVLDITLRPIAGPYNMDVMYGTNSHQKVGGQWPINTGLHAETMTKHKINMAKENVKGTVTLVKVEKVDSTDCMDVEVQVSAADFTLPLPGDAKIEKSTMEVKLTGKYPLDISARPLEESVTLTTKVTARGKPDPRGPEVVMEFNTRAGQVHKYTPLSK
jgi:hypothetical protein